MLHLFEKYLNRSQTNYNYHEPANTYVKMTFDFQMLLGRQRFSIEQSGVFASMQTLLTLSIDKKGGANREPYTLLCIEENAKQANLLQILQPNTYYLLH